MFKDKKIRNFIGYTLLLILLISFGLFWFKDMQYQTITINNQEDLEQVSNIKQDEETLNYMHFTGIANNQKVKFILNKDSELFDTAYRQSVESKKFSLGDNYLLFGLIILLLFFTFQIFKGKFKKEHTPVEQDAKKVKSKTEVSNDTFFLSHSDTKFDDIAGYDYVKDELFEIIDQLKNPDKYKELGANMIKGALFHGPPGTGKTLFARAVAGEVDVGFISITGTDFVKEYVGTGASRVKELFNFARKHQPCIIFIDEIDALATKRTGQANTKEYDNAANALLTELQGFNSKDHVVVLAATNAMEQLDPAILVWSTDRKIEIGLPDFDTRLEILKHLSTIKNRKFSKDCNFKNLANLTFNFNGADIEALINEAILFSARKNLKEVTNTELLQAFDKVSMGIKNRKNLSDKDKQVVAYHEAGHAVITKMLKPNDIIQKVTILPHGQSLGFVQKTPANDIMLQSKEVLINEVKVLLAGRACEEVFHKEITNGAEMDLKQATNILIHMNSKFGMFGKLSYRDDSVDYQVIDNQLDEYYEEVKELISNELRTYVDFVAKVLLKKELITGEELDTIIEEVNKLKADKEVKVS